MLIAVVGMPGAGKTESARYFCTKPGFGYLRFGEAVERGAKELGGVNEKNERKFREQIRKELGMKAMAVKIEPLIKEMKLKKNNIVLDGLYSWEEYEFLKQRYSELCLVCIYATPKTRYHRLSTRPHRPLNKQTARSRDIAELVNLNKGGPIAIADFLVINEGTQEELHRNLDQVYEQIGRKNYCQ